MGNASLRTQKEIEELSQVSEEIEKIEMEMKRVRSGLMAAEREISEKRTMLEMLRKGVGELKG